MCCCSWNVNECILGGWLFERRSGHSVFWGEAEEGRITAMIVMMVAFQQQPRELKGGRTRS